MTSQGAYSADSRGFTVLELLIVIGLGIIIFSAAAPLATNLQPKTQLTEQSAELVQLLRIAQQRSVAGVNGSTYEIVFTTTPGSSRASLRPVSLPPSGEIQAIEFGAGAIVTTTFLSDTVNFNADGRPSEEGSVVITDAVAGTRTVLVNRLGYVNEE